MSRTVAPVKGGDLLMTNPIDAIKVAEITSKIVHLLNPLGSEDRQKIISAVLTVLGESSTAGANLAGGAGSAGGANPPGGPGQHLDGLSARGATWMRQNQITADQIQEVFEVGSSGVTVITGNIPGNGKKTKTLNAYVLQGVCRYLASGDPSFDDKAARGLCETLGCFDGANHAATMNAKGSLFTGSKKTGWKLTAPGLKQGAALVKQLVAGE